MHSNGEEFNLAEFKTIHSIQNGMKKPAFCRHRMESLGIVSFNKTRKMFPLRLQSEKQLDLMFEFCPHLLQFKRSDAQPDKNTQKLKETQEKNPKKSSKKMRDADKSGAK